MTLETRHARKVFRRRPHGQAACLLPFEADGSIAFKAFSEAVARTEKAGLQCAVNMDTGYANYLTDAERREVLKVTRETLGPGRPFTAGAFVEGRPGELVDLYRREMETIREFGGTPILFQTTRVHAWSPQQIVDLYATVSQGFESVYGFELGRMFAPNGMIFDEATIEGLMRIPQLKGIKHSSLDRGQELRRLEIRDRVRPEFMIFTGNDLGIDMIEYGSDYLLGLAAFCPEKFAERDRLWTGGDEGYEVLSDALQHLGNIAFRPAVPAYKHSCAVFQHLLGRIPTSEPHRLCPRRPAWEAEMLKDCVTRLGY